MISEKEILQFEKTHGLILVSKLNGRLIIKDGLYFYTTSELNTTKLISSFSNMTDDSKLRYINNEILNNTGSLRAIEIDGNKVVIYNKCTNVKTSQFVNKVLHGKDYAKQLVHLTEKKLRGETLIKDAFGDGYTFDKLDYVNVSTKVTITCNKHGDFDILPNNILYRGCKCPRCGYEFRVYNKKNFKKN